jgi:glycosyltransferase involved in cell wall biosynthesis
VRIVYLNPSAELGGAERCLLDTIAAVKETEHSYQPLLIVSAEGPLVQRAEQLGVHVSVVPMPDLLVGVGTMHGTRRRVTVMNAGRQTVKLGWATWRYARQLATTLQDLKPDLIHSNGVKFHVLAGLAAPRAVPVLWHIHDFLGSRKRLRSLLKLASVRAQGAIAVSDAVQRDARTLFHRLPVKLIHNAIDTVEFSPGVVPGALLDRLAGIHEAPPETLRIGLVATFARWNGHDIFLKAAAEALCNSRLPRVRFYVVGGPIYQTSGSQFSMEELRSIATALRIDAAVGFVPFQVNAADVYRALDIVVHASTQPEPFGRTIVEAMACAKPVLVAQAGGAAEIFTHDHDATGVSPGNAKALASELCRLVVDQAKRARLGEMARRTVVDRFSRRRLGPQMLAIYRRLLHASRAA